MIKQLHSAPLHQFTPLVDGLISTKCRDQIVEFISNGLLDRGFAEFPYFLCSEVTEEDKNFLLNSHFGAKFIVLNDFVFSKEFVEKSCNLITSSKIVSSEASFVSLIQENFAEVALPACEKLATFILQKKLVNEVERPEFTFSFLVDLSASKFSSLLQTKNALVHMAYNALEFLQSKVILISGENLKKIMEEHIWKTLCMECNFLAEQILKENYGSVGSSDFQCPTSLKFARDELNNSKV